ncbi:AAA family ATPase [Pseudomonas japonica]|uniref:AAA family ATPase n=1 Tax=Pseudomonas japonica TaxID=256466 RepID=UPI0015E293E5|nr:AAA family ATPase [Pseudomonas japonica]MBA1245258.1 AAA domain-containing protein [Pseudomonas japonica]
MTTVPKNQILFGPPGTGKTYATIDAALEVLDPAYLLEQQESRAALKRRFDELVQQERIRFVTFHQSFSYEDFVEGLRASNDEVTQQLRYDVVDGVFKSLCEAAAVKVTSQAPAPIELGQRRIWKMSLGNTLGEDASIYQECLIGGYVLLGWGDTIDFSGCASRSDVQERFAQAGFIPENPATDYSITSVTAFVTRIQVGDLIVVSDGNFKFRAIGEVTGGYEFRAHSEFETSYSQMRRVKWLREYSPSLPHSELLNGQFSQMTLYELRAPTLNREKLELLLGAAHATVTGFRIGQVFGRDYQVVRATDDLLELRKPNGNLIGFSMTMLGELANAVRLGTISIQDIRDKSAMAKLPSAALEPFLVNGYNNILAPLVEYLAAPMAPAAPTAPPPEARVLIIDEINRGNVSRIFGELITLIEPSKRAGAEEALSVVLPYSKQSFSVPDNVYLIGTMNTTDRSLAGLDIALRRRFNFREMPPQPQLLDDVSVEGVTIGQLLRAINRRIEVLLDRDHCLGHAYFFPLKADNSLERLGTIFRNQVLPLLQEYFFEDWERIGWVLNDQQAEDNGTQPFVQRPSAGLGLEALFGATIAGRLNDQRWQLNPLAFSSIDSYLNVLGNGQ